MLDSDINESEEPFLNKFKIKWPSISIFWTYHSKRG